MQQSNSQPIAQWEWKSNPNPYSQSEEAQWTPYKPLDNYLLENAYYNQQEEVDLGDYVISIKDMLQKKKDNTFRQRPIRRNIELFKDEELDQDENIRAKRFFGAETPKTFNNTFGGLSDYLKFFRNRGPDIREFVNLFHDIEEASNLDLINEVVQPCLITCLQSEWKKIPETLKKPHYEKELLQLFQGTVTTIKQFYANILKAYTMEGFLYQHLNRYLRNEDWEQLDCLLPYAYCLCKAFLRSEFTTSNPSSNPQNSMTVYRGAQFDETTLSFYDLETVKNFCWNGVTSTSRKRRVAENFMYSNFDLKKVSVMFIIEVPLSLENTSKWIDIKPYSAIPGEAEIVLPPGSVFELVKVSRNNHKCVEINLKLMINVDELAHGGQIMHGALSSEMSNDTSLKLVYLEGREFSDAIALLKGNQLIEELEFSNCKFDEKTVVEPLEKIPRLKSLIFISPTSGSQTHWSGVFKTFNKASIEKLEISDGNIEDHQLNLLSQRVCSFPQLKSLALNFAYCFEITNEGLNHLTSLGLRSLTSLTSLNLNFTYCRQISDEGLSNLSQGLKHLTSLTSLTLNFDWCPQIMDKGLCDLSFQALKYLTSLRTLALDFGKCERITDKGLSTLSSQGLKYLTSLTSLALVLEQAWEITGEGLSNLSSQGLKSLTSLRTLTLDFGHCEGITDEAMSNLGSHGLRYLTSLTSLTLNFEHCSRITDEGLKNLHSQGLDYLTLLTSLNLNLGYGFRIEDKKKFQKYLNVAWKEDQTIGLAAFVRKLKDKNLNFKEKLLNEDEKIYDEGLKELLYNEMSTLSCLSPQGQKLLSSLTSLTLNFGSHGQISDEALNNLNFCSLKYLASLTSFTLNFDVCNKITDEGLNRLSSQGLQFLVSLRSLALNFDVCDKITDEGLNRLSSQGLKPLTSLTSLTLSFEACDKITDEGLNHLASQGLKNLSSLSFLSLNFQLCSEITDEGLKNLGSLGLRPLISLNSLALNLKMCPRITNEGLNYLASQGLKYLISLRSLTLNFAGCNKIRVEAWKNFCKVLKYFGYEISPAQEDPKKSSLGFFASSPSESQFMNSFTSYEGEDLMLLCRQPE